MIEIELPLAADLAAARRISAAAVVRGERAGRVEDEVPMVVTWDETVAPAPTAADFLSAAVEAHAEAARSALRAATAASIVESALVSNVLGADYLYPTDTRTQNNVHGLITKASIYPDEGPFPVWCAPASDPENWQRRGHTDEQIKALGKVYVDHVSARQDHYETLLAQVTAAVADFEAEETTADDAIAAIDAIEWTEPGA